MHRELFSIESCNRTLINIDQVLIETFLDFVVTTCRISFPSTSTLFPPKEKIHRTVIYSVLVAFRRFTFHSTFVQETF